MAPEVYDKGLYDAQRCDIWSLAIIFCCMSLKRFPWKLPIKTQDKSFRLFAAEPSSGHDPRKILGPSRLEPDLDVSSKAEGSDEKQTSVSEESKPHAELAERSQSQSQLAPDRREVVLGPWRILRLLPRESRYVIWRMLEINPARRAHMEEILADPWVANTVICQQIDDGKGVLPAADHTHTLIETNPEK
jgi:serine/threonine protein kinase